MDGASMGHGDSMSALRISAVTVTPVAFADPPLLNSVGVHEPFWPGLGVKLDRDALAGLHEQYLRCRGEIPRWLGWHATCASSAPYCSHFPRQAQRLAWAPPGAHYG